jgi:hypothetical protein
VSDTLHGTPDAILVVVQRVLEEFAASRAWFTATGA